MSFEKINIEIDGQKYGVIFAEAILSGRGDYHLIVRRTDRCMICGRALEKGITVWPLNGGFIHPECAQGLPIDHGD